MENKHLSRRKFISISALTGAAMLPAIKALSQLTGVALGAKDFQAYRIMDNNIMLQLEVYFIGVEDIEKNGRYIRNAKGVYQETFMIVRLPQQHIAETYHDDTHLCPDDQFETRIAGYSYLVFQIYFEPDSKVKKVPAWTSGFPLDMENILAWNAPYLHLVVREDRAMSDTLFKKVGYNGYPLSFKRENDEYVFDRKFYPQYSEKDTPNAKLLPVTAIEAPYRLILSPELPDHRYQFHWKFSKNSASPNGFELWMATLKVKRREGIIDTNVLETRKDTKDAAAQKGAVLPSARKNDLEKQPEKELPMDLAIIGSPDYEKEIRPGVLEASPVATRDDRTFKNTLPTADDRAQLVELYFISQSILTAKTEKLTFTPLGMCGTIEFKNVLFEQINRYKKRLDLFQWKHTMSFGRDQEVQVVNLVKVMVGCHPAMMLHVRTTKRRTSNSSAGLFYSEFLIPLEISKNLLQFEQEDSSLYNKEVYKHQHLYKSVRFATEAPKEIVPLNQCHKSEVAQTSLSQLHERTLRNKPVSEQEGAEQELKKKYLGFWAKQKVESEKHTNLEWDFIATDWHDNEIKLTSNLYLVSSALNCSPVIGAVNLPLPDLAPIKDFKKKLETITVLETLEEEYGKALEKIESVAKEWHQIYQQSEQYLLEKTDWFRDLLEKKYAEIDKIFDKVFKDNSKWEGARDEVAENLKVFKDQFYQAILSKKDEITKILDGFKKRAGEYVDSGEAEIKKFCTTVVYNNTLPGKYLEDLLNNIREPVRGVLKTPYDELKAKMTELDGQLEQYLLSIPGRYNIRDSLKEKFTEIKKILCFIENVEATCKSRIKAYNAAIGLAVYKVENGIDELKKNIREKLKDAAGPAIQVLEDYYHKANKEISSIKTEYFILRSSLRSMADAEGHKVLDFFNTQGIRHSMVSLQGTMQKISETVYKEIPVRLAHYEDYVKNQVDNELLDIKNNVLQGFAKFQSESKEKIKGVMREIGHELGGLVNPELASDLVGYYHDARAVKDEVVKGLQEVKDSIDLQRQQLANEFNNLKNEFSNTIRGFENDVKQELDALMAGAQQNIKDQLANGKNKLVLLQNEFQGKVRDVKEQGEQALRGAGKELEGYAKALGSKILGSIKLSDILGIDIEPPKYNRSSKSLYYNFITKKFKAFDIGVVKFTPSDKTRLVCYFEKSLVVANSYLSQTRLEEFTIEIFAGRLAVEFEKLEILSTPSVKSNTEVSIKDVRFEQELSFLQALSKNIKVPGTGIILNITPKGVEASYTFTFPGISAGAFTLTNLQFGVGVKIPFPIGGGPLRPIEATFGINKADGKFVVAAGIFGGRGHFVLQATPNYLKGIDCAIEFGGYLGLDLGIAKGEAYLMAGLRYVYERSPEGFSTMRFYAYITCGGSVVVFGFINISVCFILCLNYEDVDGKSSLYGTASLSLSVKIGFFEKSFTLTFSKRIMGTDSENRGDEVYYSPAVDPNQEQTASLAGFNGVIFADHREGDEDFAEKRRPVFSDAGWIQYCKSFY